MKIGCERTSYDDHHDDGGFANYIFNELCSFGPGSVNIFRKIFGLPEAAYSKQEDDIGCCYHH